MTLSFQMLKNTIKEIIIKLDPLDKVLFLCLSFFPFLMASSIFLADLVCVIISILLVVKISGSKKIKCFKNIKRSIYFFLFFYLIILISLSISNHKVISFLPSFFYFRYFLLSLCVYYLLKKYEILEKGFLIIIFFTISLVLFDSIIQLLFNYNIFGYKKMGYLDLDPMEYITSFFNDEKKLGSYLIRLLPLYLGILYMNNIKSYRYELFVLLVTGIVVFYSSERAALFLLFVIYFFYFLISEKKKIFLVLIFSMFIILFSTGDRLTTKYISFTLEQTGLTNFLTTMKAKSTFDEKKIRYYSKEHEDLSYTAYIIFKKNFIFGSGIKSFYDECNRLIKQNLNLKNSRDNKLLCSTHPHNTYLQILSEIGIFGFFMVFFLLLKLILINTKIFLMKNTSKINKSYFFINLGIIINIMPLIPSGSIFNNWISLMTFFPVGFYLYIKEKNRNVSV